MSKDIILVTSSNKPDVKKTIAGQKTEIGGLIREFRLLTGLTMRAKKLSALNFKKEANYG